MKKLNRACKTMIIALLLIFTYGFAFSQELNGKYEMGEDYFYFHKQTAEFSLQCEGGFTIPLKGVGKFEIFKEYLLIHTFKFNSVNKKYYSKSEFKGTILEEIIEEKIIAFRILSLSDAKITLILLPYEAIQQIYTHESLRKLEKIARQKEFRVRAFNKK